MSRIEELPDDFDELIDLNKAPAVGSLDSLLDDATKAKTSALAAMLRCL